MFRGSLRIVVIDFFCLRFPFLAISTFSPVCYLIYPYSCFSFYFCFLYFVVLLFVFILTLLFLAAVISLYLIFLYISWVLELLHQRNSQYWSVLFLLLFFRYKNCLYHLSGVRLWASSSISLSFDPFDWVPPLSILTNVLSILQECLPRCFFLDEISAAEFIFEEFSCP